MRLKGKGFSTLEITVALGLMAVLGLAAAGLMKNIGGQQNQISSRDEASEFVAALSLWMGTDKGCKVALQGKPLAIGGSSAISIDGYNGYGGSKDLNSGSATLQVGYRITPTVRISKFNLKDKGIAPVTVQLEGVNYRRVVAQLEIELTQHSDSGDQAQRKRYIEVPVMLDANSDIIVRCAGEPTLTDLCSAVGSVLDPATGTCKPQVNCIMQGTYMALSCSPNYYGCFNASGLDLNNAITHSQSCPAGSVASQTGIFNYSHDVECGKKCTLTVADQLVFYICMRCN
jgi:type II secretory pathway pseudopilin PulG